MRERRRRSGRRGGGKKCPNQIEHILLFALHPIFVFCFLSFSVRALASKSKLTRSILEMYSANSTIKLYSVCEVYCFDLLDPLDLSILQFHFSLKCFDSSENSPFQRARFHSFWMVIWRWWILCHVWFCVQMTLRHGCVFFRSIITIDTNIPCTVCNCQSVLKCSWTSCVLSHRTFLCCSYTTSNKNEHAFKTIHES